MRLQPVCTFWWHICELGLPQEVSPNHWSSVITRAGLAREVPGHAGAHEDVRKHTHRRCDALCLKKTTKNLTRISTNFLHSCVECEELEVPWVINQSSEDRRDIVVRYHKFYTWHHTSPQPRFSLSHMSLSTHLHTGVIIIKQTGRAWLGTGN